MKTYYYLATVVNATSRAVRVICAGDTAREAFAAAAMMLANAGFECEQLQVLTEAQYFAADGAPCWAQVTTRAA